MKAYFFSITLIFLALPLSGYNFNTYPDQQNHNESGKYSQECESKKTNYRIKKVVIDPGHGGKDSGCLGHSNQEKDLALKIALKLGTAMQHAFPEIEVIYTRKTDVFVPLHRRAALANRNKADLFISIHCNAINNASQVNGSETYVMGLHTAETNLAVAKRENSSILLEDNYTQRYQGYDPHSPEGHIILSMYQNAYLEQSILFAEKVENNLKTSTRRKSRGVKQAGFLVLRETTMPSVLIEAGYLTNQSDHHYLSSNMGQNIVAKSILNAFREYKIAIENGSTDVVLASSYPNYEKATQVYAPKSIEKPKSTFREQQAKSVVKNKNRTKVSAKLPIKYKILLASTSHLIDTKNGPWNKIDYSVQVLEEDGMYKYFVIGFQSYDLAAKAKTKLRNMGFNEAFVVGYRGKRRVFPK